MLPSSITEIGAHAFNGCSSLVSVSIPNTVTGIQKFVFNECTSLQGITLPDGLNYIGEYAFNGCVGLVSITIPNKVNAIPQKAFSFCSALQSVTIGNSVTNIGEYAFEFCTALESIKLGNSVTSIGKFAFYNCTSLQNITLPDGMNDIGGLAFSGCSALKSVTMGNSVTSIGEFAFFRCEALQSVTFKSVPILDEHAFYACNSLSSKILDLTDSDKPYIGTSLDNYPDGFTEARYHRTLEQGKWETIVLPFVPTGGFEGLEFYELKEMTANDGGSLVFTKRNALQAGVPYLVKNVSDSKTDFTLTKARPSITLTPQNQTVGGFTLKGSFQQIQLNGAENGNLYYLKDNEFYHANGKINIAPFRAYVEGNGAAQAKSFMLVVSDNDDEVTAIPGIMDEDGNIDETEAIYDLNGRRLAAPVKGQVNIVRTKSGKTLKRMF